VDHHVGELAFEQPDELERQRVALVVGIALEGEAEHRDLAIAQPAAQAALQTVDDEQRDALVDARDRQQHARGVRALLGEREVLAQAGPRRHARSCHPAPRVVTVDQVDDVEDVRVVAVAVDHQEVRQREGGVAQDVRPDLGQLRLDRGRVADGGAEHLEEPLAALARTVLDAADDARERPDLLEEAVRGDPLRAVGDEDVLAHREATVLLQVARHPFGRAGGNGRAQDDEVAVAHVREQRVEHGADVTHVDLDVGEGRGADGEHDRVGPGGVGGPFGQVEAPARAHAREELVRARLGERHPALAQRAEPDRILVDAEDAQAGVGEAEGEGQADAA
jgi:hypothetical protein